MGSKTPTNLTSIRIDDYTRKVIDRAAELVNQTRSGFLLSTARERAEEIIRERESIMQEVETLILSREASLDIAENLLKPLAPTPALIRAGKKLKSFPRIIP